MVKYMANSIDKLQAIRYYCTHKEDSKMESVKSTINIPVGLKKELNRYVALKIVPSFSGGVSAAIESYLKELRRLEYDKQMAEAAGDVEFMRRTSECHEEMCKYESGAPGEW